MTRCWAAPAALAAVVAAGNCRVRCLSHSFVCIALFAQGAPDSVSVAVAFEVTFTFAYSPSPSPSHSNSPVTFAVLFLAAGGALTQFVYILNTNTKISSSLDCLFNSIKIPRKKFQSCIIYKCELRSFNKLNWHCHWPHPLPHGPPPALFRNDNILTNCLTNAATEGSIIFQLATDKSN